MLNRIIKTGPSPVSPKKILVICSCPSAQMSAQYDAVSKTLKEYRFHILFRNASHYEESSWPAIMPQHAEWSVLPKPGWVRFLPKSIQWLISCPIEDLLRSHNPDAIIVHGLYDNTASVQSIRWCWKNNIPYLLRSDANITKHKHFWRYPLKVVGTPLVKRAKAILYIGTQNRRYYEYLGACQKQFFLAPWEHDYETLELTNRNCLERRDELRQESSVSDKVVFLFVGRILKLKGLDTLIPVVKRLKLEGLPVFLLIAGDGPYLAVLKRRYNLGDCEYIRCLGSVPREQVCRWYSCADVFVLNSYEEAWGLVVNEAAFCHLPLVVSDCVGAGPDLIKNGLNGLIYPAKDKNALYNCLKQLTLDRSLRSRMGIESSLILKEWRQTSNAVEGYRKALECVT